MRLMFFGWICAFLLAMGAVFLAVRLVCGHGLTGPAVIGLMMAAINSIVAFVLCRKAVGQSVTRFMLYGVLGNGVRLMALLVIAAAYKYAGGSDVLSFGVALVAGYMVFMVYEVVVLNAAGLRQGK